MNSAVKDESLRPWEAFDKDLEKTARAVTSEETAAIDAAVALHPISIRLPKSLIEQLKLIGRFHGVGYQPLVRDVLMRFARSEIRSILINAEKEIPALKDADSPAAKFFEEEPSEPDAQAPKRACA